MTASSDIYACRGKFYSITAEKSNNLAKSCIKIIEKNLKKIYN